MYSTENMIRLTVCTISVTCNADLFIFLVYLSHVSDHQLNCDIRDQIIQVGTR